MDADLNIKAQLDMDITRRNPDGSVRCVEHLEGEYADLPESTKKRLLSMPSFREWLRGRLEGDRA